MQERNTQSAIIGGEVRRLAVYNIIERRGMKKSLWSRIGSAFINRDGSINVFLDSFPVDGKLQVREIRDEDRPATERASVAASPAPIEAEA